MSESLWPYTYCSENNLFILFLRSTTLIMSLLCPGFFQDKHQWCLNSNVCLELSSAHSTGNKFLKPNLVLWLIPEHLHLPYTLPLFDLLCTLYLLLHSLLFSSYPQILCLSCSIPLPLLDDFTHFSGFSSTQISLKCIIQVGSYTCISNLYQKSPAAELMGTSNVHILNLWSTFFLFPCI